MTDYILKEDVLMALTGDITDCTIEEFIARLRDKLSKLTSADVISRQEVLTYVDKVLNSGMGKKKSLEFINKYIKFMPSAEVSQALVNDSQNLVKNKWKDYAIVYRQGGYSCAMGTCPICETRQEVDKYCCHCGARIDGVRQA